MWSAALAVFGSLLGMVRLAKPSVLPEAANRFRIGRSDAFPEGSTRIIPDRNIHVISEKRGIAAISLICTHLGCTVSWDDAYGRFLCPCHGSMFARNGKVLKGAAPRPLEWLKVAITGDGRILVDKGQIVDSQYNYKV